MRQPTSPLHPKSRFTASLFATTVFASFFVVVLPHILPCPAPRRSFLDDGTSTSPQPRRRRRKVIVEENGGDVVAAERSRNGDGEVVQSWGAGREDLVIGRGKEGRDKRERNSRACPIPKPSGLVGEILGFKSENGSGGEEGDESGKTCPIPRTPSEMLGFKKVLPRTDSDAEGFGRRREGGEGIGPP